MLSSTEQQRRFISVLIQSGVGPIVILDGGGTKTSIEDIVHRRKRNINEITTVSTSLQASLHKYPEADTQPTDVCGRWESTQDCSYIGQPLPLSNTYQQ